MISLDVSSLFTSIPLDTAKQITNNLLTNDCSSQTKNGPDKNDILDLLDLCLHSKFSSEAVMRDLEKRSVTKNVKIRTWDRYVDDVLATVKRDKTEDILHIFITTLQTTSNSIRKKNKTTNLLSLTFC